MSGTDLPGVNVNNSMSPAQISAPTLYLLINVIRQLLLCIFQMSIAHPTPQRC